ncbi:MAG: hypothetical protein EBR30_05505 [Cytophagia bacterium]|nr:hypothetical protein [Cytophagia bacterium]
MKTTLSLSTIKKVIFLSTLLITFIAQGQHEVMFRNTVRNVEAVKKNHIGFTSSFGVRSSTLSSNYAAIDGMQVLEEGGSAGLLWGSRSFETKLAIGYYYSAARVKHTIDLVELEATSHFYPIRAFKKSSTRVNPYITTGINKNNYKLYGFYTQEKNTATNYSVSREPYIGKVDVYNASLGAGVAISLMNDYDFVKVFAATQYNKPFSTSSSADFHQTTISGQWSFNLGVSFGRNQFK